MLLMIGYLVGVALIGISFISGSFAAADPTSTKLLIATSTSTVAFSLLLFYSALALGLAWSITVMTDLAASSLAVSGYAGSEFLALTCSATLSQTVASLPWMFLYKEAIIPPKDQRIRRQLKVTTLQARLMANLFAEEYQSNIRTRCSEKQLGFKLISWKAEVNAKSTVSFAEILVSERS